MRLEMTREHHSARFVPTTHGLHFANRWAPGPTVRLGFVDPRVVGVG